MRTIILAFLAMLCASSADAQTLFKVYTVKGNVTCEKGKVSPGNLLMAEWVMSIPDNGKVVLLDEQGKRLITLKEKGTDTVVGHIVKKGNKSKGVTGKYMSYISEKVSTKHLVDPSTYMQSQGAADRRPAVNKVSDGKKIIVVEAPKK